MKKNRKLIAQLANRNSKLISRYLLTAIFMLLASCTGNQFSPNAEELALLTKAAELKGPEFSKPRLVTGRLVVQISDLEIIQDDSLIAHLRKKELPEGLKPYVGVWSSAIRNFPTQQLISEKMISPRPDHKFIEPEYGNEILFWNILDQIDEKQPLELTRNFKFITFDYRPVAERELERQEWYSIPASILTQYTRSEKYLEQDEDLIEIVFALLEEIEDPVSQAEAIYNWVQSSMTYIYPPEERGVRNAAKTLHGDCGQYSALFITMARIAGIPARQQSGFNFYPGRIGAHVWSEIFLPVKGWVPVDATRDDGFMHLDNQRLITSLGLNIPLENAPDWTNYSNSEIEEGHTDFMQMYTLAHLGVRAHFSSEKIVLRSVELD